MLPNGETMNRPRQLAIETELFSFRFNVDLALSWVLRRALQITRILVRAITFLLSIVFGRYELVRQVGPGLPPEPVRPDDVF